MGPVDAFVVVTTSLYTARGFSLWLWYDLLGRGKWGRVTFVTHTGGRVWRYHGDILPPSKLTDALQDFWAANHRRKP